MKIHQERFLNEIPSRNNLISNLPNIVKYFIKYSLYIIYIYNVLIGQITF